MGRDYPTAPEPTNCVSKTAENICTATEGFTFQVPRVVSSLDTPGTKDLHTSLSTHCLSAGESVYLTGYCHHQPGSSEEKQEI